MTMSPPPGAAVMLGSAAAGNRAGKEYLRFAVQGVHIAQTVERIEPAGRRDRRDAVCVPHNVELSLGVLGTNSGHMPRNG